MSGGPTNNRKAFGARPIPYPAKRPLRVYTTDPTRDYKPAAKATVEVDFELLTPGPIGDRIEVVDYDGHVGAYYPAIDLDETAILIGGGMEPLEADPRFHQQMVYAVASRTLAVFDRALGRRISMRRGSRMTRLRILPHAFRGRNAYYDRDLHALLFGYFEAETENVGTNLPGQTIYTCLSHDIIAHEMTHAILDRVKRYFLEPTNPDVAAFHEGFSDLVALFQHFAHPSLVAAELKRTRADLREPTLLVQLAKQFGYGTGEGQALRTALDGESGPKLADATEAHDRGAVLAAAVFDGFLETFSERARELILIATDGRGLLPAGELSPYLADRLAVEVARCAQEHLDMCIRALDYLPPVDVTFGSYLRALITADFTVNPDDKSGQRAALIEGCRKRGIFPEAVISLAEESLRWPIPDELPIPDNLADLLAALIGLEAGSASRRSTDRRLYADVEATEMTNDPGAPGYESEGEGDTPQRASLAQRIRQALVAYVDEPAVQAALLLHPDFPVYIYSVNAAFRRATDGRPVIEIIIQFVQTNPKAGRDVVLDRDIAMRGGTTLVIGADLRARYIIARPLPGPHLDADAERHALLRLHGQSAMAAHLDGHDDASPYATASELRSRARGSINLRGLHRGRR